VYLTWWVGIEMDFIFADKKLARKAPGCNTDNGANGAINE
jgi:hypothetical protein